MISIKARGAAWWGNLERREQILVLAAAALLVISIGYFMVWAPLTERNELVAQDIATYESLLARLSAVAPGTRTTGPRKGQNLSLLAVIDQTVKSAGIGESVKRIQPDGEQTARIWLEQADFDKLLRWLHALDSQYGVSVNEATINRDDKEGLVRARIGFVRN